jgi:hypothetical protein
MTIVCASNLVISLEDVSHQEETELVLHRWRHWKGLRSLAFIHFFKNLRKV